MRRARVRLTARRLMVLVAVVAVVLGGLRGAHLAHRSRIYRARARDAAWKERWTVIAVREGPNTADRAELAALNRAWAAYHAALSRRYPA